MIEIRRILCPIDFSDFSRRALDHAVAIARWYGSAITLLHVGAATPAAAYAAATGALPPTALLSDESGALLAGLKRFAETEVGPGVAVECEVVQDSIPGGILTKAAEMPADLLVLGTHGRSGFERLVLGSVTERVLRKAGCPVLTVPRSAPDAVPYPPVLFKRIVCAIDFSDCSMSALNYASSLAQAADAHLTVVHVVELPNALRDAQDDELAHPRVLQDYIALAEEERTVRLQAAIPDGVREYCTVDTVLATGKPYREILRIAGDANADLLVIGVHGHGAIDRLLFGSTTQHLVRQASCPVLTLRTP
jgi:nucleotide-binding universal stress UspA family protein